MFLWLDIIYRQVKRVDWRVFPAVDLPRDDAYSVIDMDDSGTIKLYSPGETYVFYPFVGQMVYVEASRTIVLFDGTSWLLVARFPPLDPSVEIAFMISDPRPTETLAAHVVTKPFRLFADVKWHRTRGIPDQSPFPIFKNTSQIGWAMNDADAPSGFVQLSADTDFAQGDKLVIKGPFRVAGARCVSITLIGQTL
ncbi:MULTISPECIES: hypothetical protein [unclassified Labrenzia]|uniref:hypothetical protein n=1 Tax=unclassified Labrenzia TaxID=2648686 RepID=UPI0004B23BA8|nr:MULTISPECIES: hypothetical protein [unclassified Labrenzia]